MKNENLTEIFEVSEALREATADREGSVIRNVLIARRVSKKKSLQRGEYQRIFEDSALAGIAESAEDVLVYLNHIGEREMENLRGVRDVRNLAGSLFNARHINSEVRADFKVLGAPASRDLVFALAESKPPGVGFSIDSPLGSFKLKRGGYGENESVTEITKLNSVDIVSGAGMAQSLFESSNVGDDGDTSQKKQGKELRQVEIKNTHDLRENYAAFVAEIEAPLKQGLKEATEKIEEQGKELSALQESKNELDSIKAKDARRKSVLAKMNEAKVELPAEKIESLCEVEDDTACTSLFEAYIEIAKAKGKESDSDVNYTDGNSEKLSEAQEEKYRTKLGLEKGGGE